MIFAKFSSSLFGDFWLQLPHTDNLQGEQFAKGMEVGWGLGRSESFRHIEMRFSRHPTEPLRTFEEITAWLQQQKEQ